MTASNVTPPLNYFDDVRRVNLDQLGMPAIKAIFCDRVGVLNIMTSLDDDENAAIHDFLTSGVAAASDTRQDLIDKITKHTPIVTIQEPAFALKMAVNAVLKLMKIRFRFTPRYNWGVPRRDCVSIRIIKEMTTELNTLKLQGKDIEMDIKMNVAVLSRKNYTFDLVKQSKISFKSVENQILKRNTTGK